MIRHAAPDELLLDYASGALAEGPALAVAVHLALAPEQQRSVEVLEQLGGELLDAEPPAPLTGDALGDVMHRLDEVEAPPPVPPGELAALPAPLHPYLRPDARWARQIIGLQQIILPLGDSSHEARLMRIPPGRGIPRHVHEGREYSVVISGAFNDGYGDYAAGDMCVVEANFEHVPVATGNEICIALVVMEHSIVLSGPFGRIFNPFRWRRFRV